MFAKSNSEQGVYVTIDELVALRASAAAVVQPASLLVESMLKGDARSRQRGAGIEFEELRPYLAGDDVRTIDWRVTARRGRTSTRLYAEDRERPCYIAVDQRSSMFFGSSIAFKSVLAARIAALIAWATLPQGNRIGGFVAAQELNALPARQGRRAVLQWLQLVTRQNRALHKYSTTNLSLTTLLRQLPDYLTPDSTVIVVSDFHDLDDSAIPAVSTLSQRSSVLFIRVYDALEQSLPLLGDAGISDGVAHTRVAISGKTKALYRQLRQESLAPLQKLIDTRQVDCVDIATSDDPVQRLRHAVRGLGPAMQ